MSYELVNRVSIKGNKVYISSHSNNDTAPFHSHEAPFLTKEYQNGGQAALDRAVIDLFLNNAMPVGDHPSVLRYRIAVTEFFNSPTYHDMVNEYKKKHAVLSAEDIASLDTPCEKTEEAKLFCEYEKKWEEEKRNHIFNRLSVNPSTVHFKLASVLFASILSSEVLFLENKKIPCCLIPDMYVYTVIASDGTFGTAISKTPFDNVTRDNDSNLIYPLRVTISENEMTLKQYKRRK